MRCYVVGCPGLDATPERPACGPHWLNVHRHLDLTLRRQARLRRARGRRWFWLSVAALAATAFVLGAML